MSYHKEFHGCEGKAFIRSRDARMIKVEQGEFLIGRHFSKGWLLFSSNKYGNDTVFVSEKYENQVGSCIDLKTGRIFGQQKEHQGVYFPKVFLKKFEPLFNDQKKGSKYPLMVAEFLPESSVMIISTKVQVEWLAIKVPLENKDAIEFVSTFSFGSLKGMYSMLATNSSKISILMSPEQKENYIEKHRQPVVIDSKEYYVAEVSSYEGQVYVVCRNKAHLSKFIYEVESKMEEAKRRRCHLTIWGMTRMQIRSSQFVLTLGDSKNWSFSLFHNFDFQHMKAPGDYRSSLVMSQIEENGSLKSQATENTQIKPQSTTSVCQTTSQTVPTQSAPGSTIVYGPNINLNLGSGNIQDITSMLTSLLASHFQPNPLSGMTSSNFPVEKPQLQDFSESISHISSRVCKAVVEPKNAKSVCLSAIISHNSDDNQMVPQSHKNIFDDPRGNQLSQTLSHFNGSERSIKAMSHAPDSNKKIVTSPVKVTKDDMEANLTPKKDIYAQKGDPADAQKSTQKKHAGYRKPILSTSSSNFVYDEPPQVLKTELSMIPTVINHPMLLQKALAEEYFKDF